MKQTLQAVALCLGLTVACRADTYVVSLGPDLPRATANGRLILFFIKAGMGLEGAEPRFGPFYQSPQPIASIAFSGWPADAVLRVDNSAVAFPGPLDSFDGSYAVQAVLDTNHTDRGHNAPGNLVSAVTPVALSAQRDETIELKFTQAIPEPALAETANLKWFTVRSDLLTTFYEREVQLKAGVVLPQGYATSQRSEWAALYIVPGFGGTWRRAAGYAEMMADPSTFDVAPQCLHIMLDPECPLGHHGFADSENMGPWGSALVTELIPALEKAFKLAPRAEARLLTGHSSGGWSVLWLQLNWPETFGGCWSSAPDPVDFRAFQTVNLYDDENYYTAADGAARPSMRVIAGLDAEKVVMTAREEALMEHAIDPDGCSGEQLATYDAMFSRRSPSTGRPYRLLDPATGAINHDTAQSWAKYDMSRLIASDWAKYGPIFQQKVRLACGTKDTFYLNLAVEKFKEMLESRQEKIPTQGPGSIWLRRNADHSSIVGYTTMRWTDEWIEYLKAHGLQ